MKRAHGHFDVKLSPLPAYSADENSTRGRLSIDKHFHGDLSAVSVGEMLTAGTTVKGSAGYVAIELVSGSLHGRRGSFALQHNGSMTRGAPQLTVTVVPDSGTDELEGLTGVLAIHIAGGSHSYDFDYALPAADPT